MPWFSFGCGVLFLALLAAALAWMGQVAFHWGVRPPPPSLFVFMLGSAGFTMIGAAIWVWTRPGAYTIVREPGPEPWKAYPWDPQGARDETGERAVAYFRRSLWLAAYLVPVNSVAYVYWRYAVLSSPFLLIFDVMLVVTLARTLFLFLRFRRYGGTRLRFGRFPFLLGEPLEARLQTSKPLPAPDGIMLTLRCIQESYATTESRAGGSDGSRTQSSNDVTNLLWSSERKARPEDLSPGGRELRIRFDLPPDAKPTDFTSQFPEYWELTVRADVPGIDYAAVFLVPVYRKA